MKKLNWGHGILMAIIIMVLAILTLVIKITNEKIELVTDDYYPKELKYEEVIQKQKSTLKLKGKILIELDDSLRITFPSDFTNPEALKGEIWFYRASNKRDDMKDSIHLQQSLTMVYPLTSFSNGKYDVIADWAYNGKTYFYKETIFIEKD